MKLLFISNIIGKRVGAFALSSIMASQELGIEYHLAANFNNSNPEQMKRDEEEYGIMLHHIDFVRNPLNPQNIKAYAQLDKLIRKEKYDAIHCNTPVGGIAGRIVGNRCGVKRIIYQAHGFHFYKGAPFMNWMIYYPIERLLGKYTDALITINNEDYQLSQKFKLRKNGTTYYVPGVGIDTYEYQRIDNARDEIINELKLKKESILIISVGELNKNKNNRIIIEALGILKDNRIHYLICGEGELKNQLQSQAKKNGMEHNVHFLGYRTDIKRLLSASDIFVMPSYREGLSRSIMEAMTIGLPCVVSKIRGNTDLVKEGVNGFLCSPSNSTDFANRILTLADNNELRNEFSNAGKMIINQFSRANVVKGLHDIYLNEMRDL